MKRTLFFAGLIATTLSLNAQQKDLSDSAPISAQQRKHLSDLAPPSPARAQWDILNEFEATSGAQAGIETDGTHFFLPIWNSDTIMQYDMDGSNPTVFTIAGVNGLRDLAYVEATGLFYGSNASMNLYAMDFDNKTLESTIAANCPGITGIRHIAYDPVLDGGNGGFWVGNWNDLGAIGMNGNEMVTGAPYTHSIYGSAYDNWTDPDNPKLWLFCQGYESDDKTILVEYDINTQSLSGNTYNVITENETENLAGGACTYVTPEGKTAIVVNIQRSPNIVRSYELTDDDSISPLPMPDWEKVLDFATSTNGEVGLEISGDYFYTSTWQNPHFYQYDLDGNLVDDFSINGVPAIHDITYCNTDGLTYGSDASMTIYAVDMQNKSLERTINVNCSGVTGVRHITYDRNLNNNNGGFWIGNWDDLGAVDMNGNELVAGITHNYDMYGAAYDNWTSPGSPKLWCYTQEYTTDDKTALVEFDINSRTFGTAYHIPSSCTAPSAGGAMSIVISENTINNNAFLILNTQCEDEPNTVTSFLQWSGDGLEEINSKNGLAIFPNPAQNEFTINRPSSKNSLMQIYDLSGRVVLSEMLIQSKTKINISKLSAGNYIVKINNRVAKLIIK